MIFEFSPVTANPHLKELGIHRDEYMYDYVQVFKDLREYDENGNEQGIYDVVRSIAPHDLFFLLYFVLGIPQVNDPFVLARIHDAQENDDMVIDLWARAHFKSTIRTFAQPIQYLIRNAEERMCIFSNTKSLAKNHLRRIMTTLNQNTVLQGAFPEIFFERPEVMAPKWNEDIGCFVKRKGTYLEPSLMASGLVDNLPTGMHFTRLIYDDVIDPNNVSTPAQVEKATYFFRQSLNLTNRVHKKQISGTRYSLKDTYSEIMKQRKWKRKIYPGEVDEKGEAKRGGTPVFLSREELDQKWDEMGEYVYNSQILQKPTADSLIKFRREWVAPFMYGPETRKPNMEYYLLVDAARTKEKRSDYTVMVVIGTDYRRQYWLMDMIRDKINGNEKWAAISKLIKSWGITNVVGYEAVGAASDKEFMERMMREDGLYFKIEELGGNVSKDDRIKRMIPDCQRGRWIFPESLPYRDVLGVMHDLMIDFFEEEYDTFPYSVHDDMLDCISRIYESKMNVIFPDEKKETKQEREWYNPLQIGDEDSPSSWMANG